MGVVFPGLPTRDPPRCRTYGGVRVCSLHFTPDDYEEDLRARVLHVKPKPTLKGDAVPSVFPGKQLGGRGGTGTTPPATKRRRTPTSVRTAHAPPATESDDGFCIVVSLDQSFQSELDLNPVLVAADSDEDVDQDCALVCTSSLMELFRRCQVCGRPLEDQQVSGSGAQVRVRWSCGGGHTGLWKSSPHLRDAPP